MGSSNTQSAGSIGISPLATRGWTAKQGIFIRRRGERSYSKPEAPLCYCNDRTEPLSMNLKTPTRNNRRRNSRHNHETQKQYTKAIQNYNTSGVGRTGMTTCTPGAGKGEGEGPGAFRQERRRTGAGPDVVRRLTRRRKIKIFFPFWNAGEPHMPHQFLHLRGCQELAWKREQVEHCLAVCHCRRNVLWRLFPVLVPFPASVYRFENSSPWCILVCQVIVEESGAAGMTFSRTFPYLVSKTSLC